MKYICTVKPLKEAIKIAAENDDIVVSDYSGELTIHGIRGSNWPAGETVTIEKPYERSIRTKNEWWVPLRYFTITEEKEPVPEFIKGLYNAMTESCGTIRCEKCSLDITGDCTKFIKFIRDKWGIGNDARRI